MIAAVRDHYHITVYFHKIPVIKICFWKYIVSFVFCNSEWVFQSCSLCRVCTFWTGWWDAAYNQFCHNIELKSGQVVNQAIWISCGLFSNHLIGWTLMICASSDYAYLEIPRLHKVWLKYLLTKIAKITPLQTSWYFWNFLNVLQIS